MKQNVLNFSRRFLFILLFLAFYTLNFGQHIKISLDQKIQNATYIFEGEVISSQSFLPDKPKVIFTSHVIKVSKVLKGTFPDDEVEVITVGGNFGGVRQDITHNLELQKGWEGLFFCKVTARPSLGRSNSGLALRVYEGNQGFIRYENYINSQVAKTFSEQYTSIEKQLLSVIEQETGKRERLNPNKRERELLQWISQRSYANTAENSDKVGVEYEFVNPKITGQNSDFLEFDIEVSTFSNIFLFGNSKIYLDYDPTVWGLNLAASGKIAATKETVVLSSDYTLSVSDETSSKLKLAIDCINNPSNPFPLSITGEKLCHIKLDITNLLSTGPSIFFDEAMMQGESDFFHNGSFYDFLNVVASDNLAMNWNVLMPPRIDSIRPTLIYAGVFDTLYIHGEHFGGSKGSVFFNWADTTYNIYPNIKAEDIDVEWSDNLIKVMMFSANGNRETPGDGKVLVEKDVTNDTTLSGEILTIGYAIRNYRDLATNQSVQPVLVDFDNTNTFKFRLYQDIPLNSDTADVIRHVLKQWRCESGMNWTLSNQHTGSLQSFDDTSVISFVSNVLIDSTTFAATSSFSESSAGLANECVHNNRMYIYIREIDMFFNETNFDWFFTTDPLLTDVTKVDFWTVALHEFGHAHTLRHTNVSPAGSPSTMYAFGDEDDVEREINFFAALGAKRIMDTILVISPNCGGAITENFAGCGVPTYNVVKNKSFKIYPNPTTNNIIIEFDNGGEFQNYYLSILDIQGREVYHSTDKAAHGKNITSIEEVTQLSSGIYFVQININNQIFSAKLIKF